MAQLLKCLRCKLSLSPQRTQKKINETGRNKSPLGIYKLASPVKLASSRFSEGHCL